MDEWIKAQIVEAEDRLRAAMLASDVAALDELLAADLIFTNHLGQVLGKEDDLAAYRSGNLKITKLESSEQQVRLIGNIAVVSVRVNVSGTYDGHPANGDLRFTRVWALAFNKSWQVVAAHAGLVA